MAQRDIRRAAKACRTVKIKYHTMGTNSENERTYEQSEKKMHARREASTRMSTLALEGKITEIKISSVLLVKRFCFVIGERYQMHNQPEEGVERKAGS